jgi:hypothetical protein
MMQPLLPIFVVLTFLALLLPPILLVVTVLRQQKRLGWSTRSSILASATVSGIVALVFNLIFALVRLNEILIADLRPDAFLLLALMVSWFSFFGRIAMKSTLRHKRRLKQSRAI